MSEEQFGVGQGGSDVPGGPSQPPGNRSFSERLIGAFKLDATVYEEVEHDRDAIGQAAVVVGLAGVANGLALSGSIGLGGTVAGLIAAYVGWLVWTAVVWLIGVRMFKHTSDYEELLRTLGFVFAPQILNVLTLIPLTFVQLAVPLVIFAMTVLGFVRAVRQALDVDTGRAFFVSAMAVVAYLLLGTVLSALAARIG